MNSRTLNLARLSRDAYTAKLQYQRIRMEELEMMKAIVEDECEETQVLLNQTERQIGQIRKQLYSSGGIAACRKTGQWHLFTSDTTSRAGRFSSSSNIPHSSVSISSSSPPSPVPDKVD